MSLEIITPPATTPISRAELKTHLRVDTTAEDDYIDTVILAATDYFEQRSWRQLITATYGMYLDDFPTDYIEFPKAPLQSITSVQYVDTSGVTQTWSSALYEVDIKSEVGRLRPIDGEGFPGVDNVYNAVTITFKAGYGDAGTDVPDMIRSTIKLIGAYFYENRQNITTGTRSVSEIPVPMALGHLINQYSLREFV